MFRLVKYGISTFAICHEAGGKEKLRQRAKPRLVGRKRDERQAYTFNPKTRGTRLHFEFDLLANPRKTALSLIINGKAQVLIAKTESREIE